MLFSPGYPGLRSRPGRGGSRRVRGHDVGRPGRPVPARRRTKPITSQTDFDQLYGVAIGPGDTDRVRRTRHRSRARAAIGQRRDSGVRPARSGRRGVRPGRQCRWSPSPVRAGWCGWPGRHRDRGRRTCSGRRASSSRDGQLYIVDAGAKEVIAFDLNSKERHTIASGLPVGPPPGVEPKPLKGMPPFSGPQGPFAGIAAGPRRHPVRFGRRRRQRAGAAAGRTRDGHAGRPPLPSGGAHPAQGDRRRGVSRWAHSCRPNTNCASGSRSAATRSARRCAGCATTTWSRRGPRAGTLVVPRPATNSYAQDVMSINDLLAFATGARSRSSRTRWSRSTTTSPRGPDSTVGSEWLAVRGYRQADGSRRTGVQDRVLHQPRLRRGGQAAATALRPDLPAHRGPVRGEHRRGAPGDRCDR